ncbi:MAG TPA: HAMP domain-containing sensor histidine kinase [Candidatus Dormibacteraeota bacterium]|nr:HAMP domain-containing sensor histidine kinase [Candidatus Dormibacteraeota bacterium]
MDFGRTTPTHVASSQRIDIPFDALVRLSTDGLALVSHDGLVLAWSDVASAITTIVSEAAIGASFSALFNNTQALIGLDGTSAHVTLVPVSQPALEIRALAVATGEGHLVSFGPQRRFEQIEQLKSELLATLSHELKTPLATIKAFATTLRENPSDEKLDRDDYLRTIDQQADRLARALDGLLRAARVSADQLPRRRERIALDRLLEDALAELPLEAADHPVERRTLGVDVCGDPALLREILVHVLRNAMMFSREGAPVEVSGSMIGTSTAISVRDRGIGIDAEHLPYIFERFYRAEPKMTASTSGAGLGLFIVRALVRAHGGSISVESTLGSGTLVTITLPVRE